MCEGNWAKGAGVCVFEAVRNMKRWKKIKADEADVWSGN